MKKHELRLAELHNRDVRHLKNLNNFIADDSRFSRLPDEDKRLIIRQAQLMTELVEVLEIRMRRLNIPV